MLREYDRVKLHITVMNSLMRKDLSHAIITQRGRTDIRDRESFDATRLLQVIIIDFLWKLYQFVFFIISALIWYKFTDLWNIIY